MLRFPRHVNGSLDLDTFCALTRAEQLNIRNATTPEERKEVNLTKSN